MTKSDADLQIPPDDFSRGSSSALPGTNQNLDSDSHVLSRLSSSSPYFSPSALPEIHRGALDLTTVTMGPPLPVMRHLRNVLQEMGVQVQVKSLYKLRCVRVRRKVDEGTVRSQCLPSFLSPWNKILPSRSSYTPPTSASSSTQTAPIYGDPTQDTAREVRFSVELTRIERLEDTYAVNIRRIKGDLRSFAFLYDALRDRADFPALRSQLTYV